MGVLSRFRVLEISDDLGAYAGKLLAELGADVVRVELPDTIHCNLNVDPSPGVRNYLDRSKRTLKLSNDAEELRRSLWSLIESADVLLEAGPLGLLSALGVNPDAACLQRQDLVWVKVTPFGTAGTRAQRPSSDLTCSAGAGFLSLGGWPDRAPTRAYGDQSWRMASLHAATGTLLALLERDQSGLGQKVEVSAQEAVATALENSLQFYDLEGKVRTRTGSGYNEAGTGVYACADGFVYVMVGRLSTQRGWENLLTWFDEAGLAEVAALRASEWNEQTFRLTEWAQQLFRGAFEKFAASRKKADLYVEAQQRGIAISPINSAMDLVANEQLRTRGFFVTNGNREEVGPPYRLSKTPWQRGPNQRQDCAK